MNKKIATRRALAAAGACLTGVMLTACQPVSSSTAGSAPTTAGTEPTTVVTTAPVVAASTTAAPPVAPTTPVAVPTTNSAQPTLGLAGWGAPDQKGYGQVEPGTIFNGGDPSGLVTGVTWSGWGSSTATGSGTAEYIAPGQSDATGTQQHATVAAFDLGVCDGKLMYQEIEWYFPSYGQHFNPNSYINICTGAYHNM